MKKIARLVKKELCKLGAEAITFDKRNERFDFVMPCGDPAAYYRSAILLHRNHYTVVVYLPMEPDYASVTAEIIKFFVYMNRSVNPKDMHLDGYWDLSCCTHEIEYKFSVMKFWPARATPIAFGFELIRTDIEAVMPYIRDILSKTKTADAVIDAYEHRESQTIVLKDKVVVCDE